MLFNPGRIATYLAIAVFLVVVSLINYIQEFSKSYIRCAVFKRIRPEYCDEQDNIFYTQITWYFIYIVILGIIIYILTTTYPSTDFGIFSLGSRYPYDLTIICVLIIIYILIQPSLFLPENDIDDIQINPTLNLNDPEVVKLFAEHKIDFNEPPADTIRKLRILSGQLHADKKKYATVYDEEQLDILFKKIHTFYKQYKAQHKATDKQDGPKASDTTETPEEKKINEKAKEKPFLYFIGNTSLYRWFANIWLSINPDIIQITNILIPIIFCIILLPMISKTVNLSDMNDKDKNKQSGVLFVLYLIYYIYVLSMAILEIVYLRIRVNIYNDRCKYLPDFLIERIWDKSHRCKNPVKPDESPNTNITKKLTTNVSVYRFPTSPTVNTNITKKLTTNVSVYRFPTSPTVSLH